MRDTVSSMLALLLLSLAHLKTCEGICPGMQYSISAGSHGTKVLLRDIVKLPAVTGSATSTVITYPRGGVFPSLISGFDILNQSPRTEVGGCVALYGQAVGFNYMVVQFQAEPGHEINFTIQIYGF